MKEVHRITKTEYDTFIIENRKESDNLNYFEFFLKCIFGVKKYYWQPDYFKIFDTFKEAIDYIKPFNKK